MNTPETSAHEDLHLLLQQRDEIIATGSEFELLAEGDPIENAAIRELGQIVLDSTSEGCTVYSCT